MNRATMYQLWVGPCCSLPFVAIFLYSWRRGFDIEANRRESVGFEISTVSSATGP